MSIESNDSFRASQAISIETDIVTETLNVEEKESDHMINYLS